jgi:hypothetical protein
MVIERQFLVIEREYKRCREEPDKEIQIRNKRKEDYKHGEETEKRKKDTENKLSVVVSQSICHMKRL